MENVRPIEVGQDTVPGVVVHIAADLGAALQNPYLISVVSQFPGSDSTGKSGADHHSLAGSRGLLHNGVPPWVYWNFTIFLATR